MRVDADLTYFDLGLVQPVGGSEVGELASNTSTLREVPNPDDVTGLRLIDGDSGDAFTFKTNAELRHLKYQR